MNILLVINIFISYFYCINCHLNCPLGWKYAKNVTKDSINKCYRLSREKANFFVSLDNCRKLNGELVVVENINENMLLQHWFMKDNPLRSKGYDEDAYEEGDEISIWLGGIRISIGNSNNSFRWIYGQRLNYSNWELNEPSDNNGNCILLLPNGYWQTTSCNKKYNYVCELEVGLKEKIKNQRLIIYDREFGQAKTNQDILIQNLQSQKSHIYTLTTFILIQLLFISLQVYFGSFRKTNQSQNDHHQQQQQSRNDLTSAKEQENTYNNNFNSLTFEQ